MSQDRTFVPGMDNAMGMNDFMYSRNTTGQFPSTDIHGTIVPGMAPKTNGSPSLPIESINSPSKDQESRNIAGGMPVIGFLYSISNQGVPEYWPLLLGYNRIGRNDDNEIVLHEQTVSGLHASIMVQKKRSGEVVSVIRLEQGRTGVLVNDEEVDLRYGSECKNGDVIQIGSAYTLAVVLINAEAMGLKVAENFITSESKVSVEEEVFPFPPKDGPKRPRVERPGTIAMDGSTTIEAPGGTRFM